MADVLFYLFAVALVLACLGVVALALYAIFGLAFGTVFFPLMWIADGVRGVMADVQRWRQARSRSGSGR
ncbi:hypothetical protein [Humibacter sp.]|uniref:hypothetical protein n=1 Tax=Humibacter sp. TaxID=1940291 RepID=UPI003F82088E